MWHRHAREVLAAMFKTVTVVEPFQVVNIHFTGQAVSTSWPLQLIPEKNVPFLS